MILFKPSLNVDILEITVDKNGRFLVANININQDNLCLVNIYAPNDQNQQVNFLDKIIDPVRRSSTNNILLGGDPGGVLPYMGYIGMCRCEGYGFQAVYSRIGYINQSVWV